MGKQIKVLVDTNIVDSNTKDNLAVEIINTNPIIGDYIVSENRKLKGATEEETKEFVYLGRLKEIITDLDVLISRYQQNIADLEVKKIETQQLIDEISPKLDEAIAGVIAKNQPVEELPAN